MRTILTGRSLWAVVCLAFVVLIMNGPVSNAQSRLRKQMDFDNDNKADYSVFRNSNNTWYISKSAGGILSSTFGVNTDFQAPGDYDNDGKADICVWRDSVGTFYYIRSSDSVVVAMPWGTAGDEPAPRDYDGDNITDFAVVRRAGTTMVWYIRQSTTGTLRVENFGIATDFIAPGDYDGDGKFDVAVQRGGTFYILQSLSGFTAISWGLANDFVVPGDYDNDGKTDLAVARDSAGAFTWYIRRSSDLSLLAVAFGSSATDFTVQNDYDGDGRCDIAVWRDTTGTFYVRKTIDGALITTLWGSTGDFPVAAFDTH